jgi:hypothetical protein
MLDTGGPPAGRRSPFSASVASAATTPIAFGALHMRPRFEMRVILRTAAMTAAEEELRSALVAYDGG